jgi:alkylhydroperoxidase family enzyme
MYVAARPTDRVFIEGEGVQPTSEATTNAVNSGTGAPKRLHHAAEPYVQWLRVGAVAAGLGFAVTTGHGVAAAESSDVGSESSDSSASGTATSQSSPQEPTSTVSAQQDTDSKDDVDPQSSPQEPTSTVSAQQNTGSKDDVDPQSSAQKPTSTVSAQQNTDSEDDGDSVANPIGNVDLHEAPKSATAPLAPSAASIPSTPDRPAPVAPVGALINPLGLAVRDIDGSQTDNRLAAASTVGPALYPPINSLFAFGGRCGLICNGADGTQADPDGVGGGWLFGDGGDGWSSTVAGVAGGKGGNGGLLWGNGGNGGDGGAGVNGSNGTTGLNAGRGADGTAGGAGGAGGNAGLLFGRGGSGGAGGAGGTGGTGAHGTDALAAEDDGGSGGIGGKGGAGGTGGAGGKGSLLFGDGGDGGDGGAAGKGGIGGFGGTGGATVVTLAGGKLSDSDGFGGAAGAAGAAGQVGVGGIGGAGGVMGQAGVNGVSGAVGQAGKAGGEGGNGGLSGRLPYLDLDAATQAQADLVALMKQLGLPIQAATGIQLVDAEGRLIGPLNVWLYNPVTGKALFDVGNTFSSSTLPARVKEIVILSVGGQWGSRYELYAHEIAAGLYGVPAEAITSLSSGQAPVGLTGNELVAAQFVQELIKTHRVSNATYAAAVAAFGQTGVVDMVNLAGTYLGVSATLNAFEIKGPGTQTPGVLPTPASWTPAPVDGPNGLGGRLPLLDLDTATAAQLALDAAIKQIAIPTQAATGIQLLDSEGRLIGPLNAYLYNPVIGKALFDVGNTFASSTLPSRVKEVVVLSVGGLWGSEYETWSHEKVARLVGLPEDAITALSNGQPPVGLTGNELIAAQFVQELVSTYRVSDETYHAAEAAFGHAGLVDMVNLASTYLGASALLNAFEVPVPPEAAV